MAKQSKMTPMTRAQLRDFNRQLALIGERYCPGCDARHPLNQAHWYFSRKGRDRSKLLPSDVCINCYRFRQSETERLRYEKDAEFRKKKKAYSLRYMSDPAQHTRRRELNKLYMRRVRAEQRRFHFQLVIRAVKR